MNRPSDVATERKSKGRVKKFLLGAVLTLIAVAVVAHFAWKYSGSNQWRKAGERRGVIVYAMKSPGSSVEKFKAVWKIHSRLPRFVMWASDLKTDTMKKEGLYGLRIIDRPSDLVHFVTWKQPFGRFLRPREFVTRNEYSQDPNTKALFYTVKAAPQKIPADDCCVRIEAMDNSWTLTPLKNGEIEMQWYVNMDVGGAIPYAAQNMMGPQVMLGFAPKVEGFMEAAKYQNARYDWIQEPQ